MEREGLALDLVTGHDLSMDPTSSRVRRNRTICVNIEVGVYSEGGTSHDYPDDLR